MQQPADPGRGPITLLRDRTFGLFFAGNLISNSGTWFHSLAQALLVYRLTGSTVLVGLVGSAQFAGTFLVAPWAGSLVDRLDRRRLAMGLAAVSAGLSGTLAMLVALDLASTPIVLVIALAIGLAWAFTNPALHAMIPSLVEPASIPQATVLHSLSFNLARAIGPTSSAVIIARFGLAAAFALNSLSFLALLAAFRLLTPMRPPAARAQRALMRATIAIVRRDLRLLLPLAALASLAFAMDPIITLGPAFATRVFGRPDTLAGHFISAEGFGAVLTAVLIARRPRPSYPQIGSSLLVLAAAMSTFAVSPVLPLSFAALAVAGAAIVRTITSATTLLQLQAADEHRGRVLALWSVSFLGFRSIAAAVDGAVAASIGIRAGAIVMTIPALVVAAWILSAVLRVAQAEGALPRGAVSRPDVV